ncbi:hypothetical protein [Streptomyces sp. AK02-01A]|uniref:hypothetical protein n=1 Tax=Streptomyces sp. AK02-01A TaxID=3028648 RepID=UPI0029A3D632|nr:hypothetical protein [Streptomyces sp. AK02-01A]MDX3853827.1 hypothetical protein [Streptomyces sp. AK02-01A]
MGIESDQLVYDYLSRVGDVAQRQQLPSGDRMRLVSALRNEIDRQRAKFGSDSPAAIRRILGRLGTPDSVVRAASTGGTAAWAEPPPEPSGGPEVPAAPQPLVPEPAVPEQRSGLVKGPLIPEQATGSQQRPAASEGTAGPAGPAGPGTTGPGPDWWSVQPGPLGGAPGGRTGRSTGVPGFVGGVEIPEILKPPPEAEEDPEKRDGDAEDAVAVEAAEQPAGGFRWRPRLPRRGERERARGLFNPFLLLAAVLLVVGAVLGSWLALGGGWLLAYASRTLSRAEAKWAVFGLPGVSAAGGLVWLWGRLDGRWGEAIPEDGMAEAFSGLWPVVVRTAAVTSALYLVWRARKK